MLKFSLEKKLSPETESTNKEAVIKQVSAEPKKQSNEQTPAAQSYSIATSKISKSSKKTTRKHKLPPPFPISNKDEIKKAVEELNAKREKEIAKLLSIKNSLVDTNLSLSLPYRNSAQLG